MSRRKKLVPPPDWVVVEEVTINNRTITAGTEVSIEGERGRYRFMKKVIRPELGVEWLDFWGGPKGFEQWRSFPESRVKRVHRINTTGKNLLKERKENNEQDAA
jgi:hypothetical protein